MCLAVFKPVDASVSFDKLEAGFHNNSNGAGFAYVNEESKVVIQKGFFVFDDFQKALKLALDKYEKTSPFLIHFRIRTSGDVSESNCHPFAINNGAMIHNGSFFWGGQTGDSDTAQVAQRYSKVFTKEAVLANKERTEQAVGSFNKIVFLFNDKTHCILNETQGAWVDGIWYSNQYSISAPRRRMGSQSGFPRQDTFDDGIPGFYLGGD